jgi:hypothetical protein
MRNLKVLCFFSILFFCLLSFSCDRSSLNSELEENPYSSSSVKVLIMGIDSKSFHVLPVTVGKVEFSTADFIEQDASIQLFEFIPEEVKHRDSLTYLFGIDFRIDLNTLENLSNDEFLEDTMWVKPRFITQKGDTLEELSGTVVPFFLEKDPNGFLVYYSRIIDRDNTLIYGTPKLFSQKCPVDPIYHGVQILCVPGVFSEILFEQVEVIIYPLQYI